MTSPDDVLGRSALFESLDEEDARELRSLVTSVQIGKGERLFSEGDAGDELYVVLDGKVKLTRAESGGREDLLSVHGPGEMFGELSMFDPAPRITNATAVTDARLAALGHAEFLHWLTGRPAVSIHMLQMLAQRLRRINGGIEALVFSDVPARVAKALLDLAARFGVQRPDGLQIRHDLTQEELAQLIGASRETVNKALADFAARGWLLLSAKSVLILNPERLRIRAG